MAAKPPTNLTDPPARTKFLDDQDQLISWPWLKWLGEFVLRFNHGPLHDILTLASGGSGSTSNATLAAAGLIPTLLPNHVTNVNLAATATVTTIATVPSNVFASAPAYLRNEGTAGNWIISFGGLVPASANYSVKLGPGDSTLGTLGEAFKEANAPIGTIQVYHDNPGAVGAGKLTGFVAWADGVSPLAGPQGVAGPQGAQGNPGANGANGTNGSTWRSGSGAPSNSLGVDGDYYFRTDTDDVYLRSSGTYSVVANIKGSTGAQGPSGTGGSPSNNDFRLTLSSGNAVYSPQPATPSSTDTTNMTVTFSTDPGWTNGTIATVSATVGGLTAGTLYYIRRRSSTLYSFHTSVAGAEGDTSKVTLSASITSEVRPSGVSATSIKLTPYKGSYLGLYASSAWSLVSSAEVSLALGTLTSGKNYDVWAYNNSGTLTLELSSAWTNDTTRATALTTQDGIWVKSGDSTRRYLGTIRTDSTTTTIDDGGHLASQTGGKRYVWNVANRVRVKLSVRDATTTWTYGSATVRQANGAAGNKVELVIGLSEDDIAAEVIWSAQGANGDQGIGVDSITAYRWDGFYPQNNSSAANGEVNPGTSRWDGRLAAGYHYIAWLEASPGAASILFVGENGASSRSGLVAVISA